MGSFAADLFSRDDPTLTGPLPALKPQNHWLKVTCSKSGSDFPVTITNEVSRGTFLCCIIEVLWGCSD